MQLRVTTAIESNLTLAVPHVYKKNLAVVRARQVPAQGKIRPGGMLLRWPRREEDTGAIHFSAMRGVRLSF